MALGELTDDELRAREELLQELTQLRTNAIFNSQDARYLVDGNLDRRLPLARRLRALRQERWPGISLTQGELAQALGGDYRLSVPLISSWGVSRRPEDPTLEAPRCICDFLCHASVNRGQATPLGLG